MRLFTTYVVMMPCCLGSCPQRGDPLPAPARVPDSAFAAGDWGWSWLRASRAARVMPRPPSASPASSPGYIGGPAQHVIISRRGCPATGSSRCSSPVAKVVEATCSTSTPLAGRRSWSPGAAAGVPADDMRSLVFLVASSGASGPTSCTPHPPGRGDRPSGRAADPRARRRAHVPRLCSTVFLEAMTSVFLAVERSLEVDDPSAHGQRIGRREPSAIASAPRDSSTSCRWTRPRPFLGAGLRAGSSGARSAWTTGTRGRHRGASGPDQAARGLRRGQRAGRRRVPHAQFVVVGDGERRVELEALVARGGSRSG